MSDRNGNDAKRPKQPKRRDNRVNRKNLQQLERRANTLKERLASYDARVPTLRQELVAKMAFLEEFDEKPLPEEQATELDACLDEGEALLDDRSVDPEELADWVDGAVVVFGDCFGESLAKRFAAQGRTQRRGDSSRTIGERIALRWAIEICKSWIKDDPLIDYDWYGVPFTEEATIEDTMGLLGCKAQLRGEPVTITGARLLEAEQSDSGRRTIRLVLERSEETSVTPPSEAADRPEFAVECRGLKVAPK